ncbi:alpha/beta hydrolase family protein [Winogradskyella vidalii]|uniref:alpha/beta hydrolase family protein n=1 Tax=Winogradskyella vidalii TaxID=2615024 RepID=UPI0015CC933D|nr:prolyl oligopeptidase family serine peptidase [Winogradskyella vidalii]
MLQGAFVQSIIFVVLFISGSFGLWGQNGRYKSELDTLWTKDVFIQKLSNDGNWVTVKSIHNQKPDSYLLLNTSTHQTKNLGDCFKHDFNVTSTWLGLLSPNHNLELMSLSDDRVFTYEGVINFEFDAQGDYLSIKKQTNNFESTLLIMDLESFEEIKIERIKEFAWHPVSSILALNTELGDGKEVSIRYLNNRDTEVVTSSAAHSFSQLQWNTHGTSLVFIESDKEPIAIHSKHSNGLHYVMGTEAFEKQFPKYSLTHQEIKLSDDGESVFFYRILKEQKETSLNLELEIWDTKDAWIYPKMAYYNSHENQYFLTLWNLTENTLQEVTNVDTPSTKYHPNHSFALVYNKLLNEPLYKQFEDVNIFVKDLKTGKKDLLVENQYNRQGDVSISSTGRYVAYFKNQHWWLYDTNTAEKTNLTKELSVSFENLNIHGSRDFSPYGSPGWSDDDRYIILYDEYDVWLVPTQEGLKKRITRGREDQVRYRISKDSRRHDSDFVNALRSYAGLSFSLKQSLIFNMIGKDLQTGYSVWSSDTQSIDTIYYGSKLSDNLLIAAQGEHIVFKKSKYNYPPSVHSYNLNDETEKLLFQSNPKLLEYDLGEETIFSYAHKNDTLRGLLFYPSHFDPTKSYPMIVKTYESFGTYDLMFKAPGLEEMTGFNKLNYITNDYFIMIPTVKYIDGQPGVSALESVTSAVKEVIRAFPIDKERIGIIGHSFGGYEVNYIATSSDLFKAAVAGAAVSDLVSWYHDIGWDWRKDQIWRIENQQFRMAKPYYLIKDKYRDNSPINLVEEMSTPLLLWNGQKDSNTNWAQGIYMFMAMKRLNKHGKLLLFKDEGHFLVKKRNQITLSLQIKNWFDSFLKKEWSE